jgi:Ham1 family protein
MKELLFATGNKSKAKRFTKGLLANDIKVLTLEDVNINIEVEENGTTAIENALIKARAYAKETNLPVFAMDDTLYLENVPEDKQPGMYVRRVNGKRLTDEEMIEYYSNLAKEYGTNGLITGRWIYGMALISNGHEYTYTWSKENFYITSTPSKIINPGYPLNTISINIKLNKYFTDMTEEDKLLVQEDESHVVDFLVNSITDSKAKKKK